MNPIVYADFTGQVSFMAGHRVDVLRAAGIAVDRRAVELAPRRPVTGSRLDTASRTALKNRSRRRRAATAGAGVVEPRRGHR